MSVNYPLVFFKFRIQPLIDVIGLNPCIIFPFPCHKVACNFRNTPVSDKFSPRQFAFQLPIPQQQLQVVGVEDSLIRSSPKTRPSTPDVRIKVGWGQVLKSLFIDVPEIKVKIGHQDLPSIAQGRDVLYD